MTHMPSIQARTFQVKDSAKLIGIPIPEGVNIAVYEESPTSIHLVIPADSGLNEDDLNWWPVASGATTCPRSAPALRSRPSDSTSSPVLVSDSVRPRCGHGATKVDRKSVQLRHSGAIELDERCSNSSLVRAPTL